MTTMPIAEVKREARALIGGFVVDRPLYVAYKIHAPLGERSAVLPGTIRRFCDHCRVETNWANQLSATSNRWSLGMIEGHWRCVQCGKEDLRIWFDIEEAEAHPIEATKDGSAEVSSFVAKVYTLRKVGQWPPWNVRPDPALEAALDPEDAVLYRRALMNISQGYGIGALAYFRRVVENETGRLLALLEELARDEEDEDRIEEIAKAKKGFNADERLRLAAEATPKSLTIGGVNPLKTIYGIMSGGMHSGSEDECVEVAEELRASFEYVFRHVRAQTQERAELRRVLSKRRDKEKK